MRLVRVVALAEFRVRCFVADVALRYECDRENCRVRDFDLLISRFLDLVCQCKLSLHRLFAYEIKYFKKIIMKKIIIKIMKILMC